MNCIKAYLICLIFFLFVLKTEAQKNNGLKLVMAADSVASGNHKDVLTSFFKLSINDVTTKNKQFDFSSNLFAILLKKNPKLDIDTNYVKYTFERNTNLNFGLKLNDENKFNGYNVGFKYAIVNKRDYTIAKEFIPLVLNSSEIFFKLNKAIAKKISTIADVKKQSYYLKQIQPLFTDTAYVFDNIDTTLQRFVIECAKDEHLITMVNILEKNGKISIASLARDNFNQIKKSFQNKPLWTVGFDIGSSDEQFQLSNMRLTTSFMKGIVNENALTNIELVINASLELADDSTIQESDLKRNIFSGEAGFNWVVKGMVNNFPFIEFKLTAAENFIIAGTYNGENTNPFTMNGTLRIHISDKVSIPVEIKYDPKTGNVFGFLNITSNFTGLGILNQK